MNFASRNPFHLFAWGKPLIEVDTPRPGDRNRSLVGPGIGGNQNHVRSRSETHMDFKRQDARVEQCLEIRLTRKCSNRTELDRQSARQFARSGLRFLKFTEQLFFWLSGYVSNCIMRAKVAQASRGLAGIDESRGNSYSQQPQSARGLDLRRR